MRGVQPGDHAAGATQSLIDTVHRHLDQLAVNKQELETIHERLRVAQTGIAAAESRAETMLGPGRAVHSLANESRVLGQPSAS